MITRKMCAAAMWCVISFGHIQQTPGAGPAVLFDQGHGQRFTIEGEGALDLSRLASLFQEAGAEVKSVKGEINAAALSGARGLVISGPFAKFTPEEAAAVRRFVEEGGRLSVMLHIGPSVSSLLVHLGVGVSRGVVNEKEGLIEGKPLDFIVTRLEPHTLTEGLDRFRVYGSWALKNSDMSARVIARTGPSAWMDTDRDRRYTSGEPVESWGIVVAGDIGGGSFLFFADDAIFQNQFLKEENLILARNLVRWMLE